ncbi:MAG: Fic family protein [Acidimicrobiales bacterium]
MSDRPRWARGSNEYVKRPAIQRQEPDLVPPGTVRSNEARHPYEDTGLTWEAFDVETIPASEMERSRRRFRAHLPDLIWNTAALEGNNFTLPEVRTLLEGVTIGGKRLEDEHQIIALSEAYGRLEEMVGRGEFAIRKDVSDELHALAARLEALDAGRFCCERTATGDGTVSLANGGWVEGTEHGDGGVLLRQHFDDLTSYLSTVEDPRRRALIYFASATRRQLYFDGNKRTARLMMTGELMSSGYDVVSIQFSRRLEFNNALDMQVRDLEEAIVVLTRRELASLEDLAGDDREEQLHLVHPAGVLWLFGLDAGLLVDRHHQGVHGRRQVQTTHNLDPDPELGVVAAVQPAFHLVVLGIMVP